MPRETRCTANTYYSKMTQTQRANAYAQGMQVDHIPVSLSVRETMAPMYGYSMGAYRRSFEVRRSVWQAMHEEFGCEGITIGTGLKKMAEALGAQAIYPENDYDHLKTPVLSAYKHSLASLDIPNPGKNAVLSALLLDIGMYKNHFGHAFPIKTDLAGPFTTAGSIAKVEQLLMDCITHPMEVKKLLNFSVECQLSWVRAAYEAFGVTSVGVSDPVATLNLLNPALFREFAQPALKMLCQGIVSITGKAPGLHICGRTKPVWDDIADCGFSSFHVDNCENIEELKAIVGDKMGIMGNVPPVGVLLQGTPQKVDAAVQSCIEMASDSPCGFTLAAGCQIPPGVPRENLHAYIKAARYYGAGAQKGKTCRGTGR